MGKEKEAKQKRNVKKLKSQSLNLAKSVQISFCEKTEQKLIYILSHFKSKFSPDLHKNTNICIKIENLTFSLQIILVKSLGGTCSAISENFNTRSEVSLHGFLEVQQKTRSWTTMYNKKTPARVV